MKITLNGQPKNLAADTSLAQLIELEGLVGKRLAAEVNQEIIPKTQHPAFILHELDTVEIVHAIGGG